MIEGVIGLPGAGKTLWTVARMVKQARKGRRILANFVSPQELWSTALWAEMIEEYNAWCVIDEAQMWFSAREWTKTKQIDLGVFQQHRKNGLDLTWIAQHQNRVDVGIREITAFIWRVSRIGKLVVIRKFQPDDMNHPLHTSLWWIDERMYQYYDTYQIIGDREGNGARAGRARLAAGGGLPGEVPRPVPTLRRLEYESGVIRYMKAAGVRLGDEIGCVSNEPVETAPAGQCIPVSTATGGEVCYARGIPADNKAVAGRGLQVLSSLKPAGRAAG